MYTILTQGKFTSDGNSDVILVPSSCDMFQIVNTTHMTNAMVANSTQRWTWYAGMGDNNAIHETNIANRSFQTTAALQAGDYLGARGITLIDSTTQTPSASRATTASTNVAAPVVSTANTVSLFEDETVIRLYNITNAPTICGIDYSVTALTNNTNFTLPTHANAPGLGGGGSYRIISYTAHPLFYPTNRTVINVEVNGTQADITTSVYHQYEVGSKVRFTVPASCGMTELDGMTGTVTTTSTGGNPNMFTVDININGFSDFEWPVLADSPTSFANVTPIGIDATREGPAPGYVYTASAATYNNAFRGVLLGAGVGGASAAKNSPAGENGDVLYWTAFKSFNL